MQILQAARLGTKPILVIIARGIGAIFNFVGDSGSANLAARDVSWRVACARFGGTETDFVSNSIEDTLIVVVSTPEPTVWKLRDASFVCVHVDRLDFIACVIDVTEVSAVTESVTNVTE
jgi:hypothetical protein